MTSWGRISDIKFTSDVMNNIWTDEFFINKTFMYVYVYVCIYIHICYHTSLSLAKKLDRRLEEKKPLCYEETDRKMSDEIMMRRQSGQCAKQLSCFPICWLLDLADFSSSHNQQKTAGDNLGYNDSASQISGASHVLNVPRWSPFILSYIPKDLQTPSSSTERVDDSL